MSIFSFLKRKEKKEKTEGFSDEVLELGIERAVQKKEAQLREESKELELEDYKPDLNLEEEHAEEVMGLSENVQPTKEECLQMLTDHCEQVSEINRVTEHAKIEYQAVSEYLSDIQKVERMPEEERKLLNDAASKILELTKEREKYQKREISIANPCFRGIRQFEGTVLEDCKNMREQEAYQKKVENDLRQIRAEKAALLYDYEHIPERQRELKQLMIGTGMIVISLFLFYWVLMQGLGKNMTVPFVLTVLMAAVVTAYIFYESYRNRYEHKQLEQKLNRAIYLNNKVKIKYINTKSALDYSYSKYQVHNAMELEYLMKEYNKAMQAEKTYESNTGRLTHYRDKVLDILEFHGVKDNEIWLHQLSVLLNSSEFQEMRESLEARKQRLIDKMDENARTKDRYFEKMHCIVSEQPELKNELVRLMAQYSISL